MPPPPLDRRHRPRPPTCWEIARRRAAQARERRQRRRGRGGPRSASAVVRDLLTRLEGMVIVALAMTITAVVTGSMTELLRRPARPAAPPPSRRLTPVRRPSTVYGHAGFDDAQPGESLRSYQARHHPAASARYRASPRTQALYLHRLLAGRPRPSDDLAPALAEAVAKLDAAVRSELALVPPERLVRRLQAIASGQDPAAVEPPPDGGPAAGPEDDLGPEV